MNIFAFNKLVEVTEFIFTDKYGLKYEKEVYAVPGNINNKTSAGTNANMLIIQWIKPYLSTKDVVFNLEVMNMEDYSENEKQRLSLLLSNKAISIDMMKLMLNLKDTSFSLEELVLEMEVKEIIKQPAGLWYHWEQVERSLEGA